MILVNLEYLTRNQLPALISKRTSEYFDLFLSVLPRCKSSQQCGVCRQTTYIYGSFGTSFFLKCQRPPKGYKMPPQCLLELRLKCVFKCQVLCRVTCTVTSNNTASCPLNTCLGNPWTLIDHRV